MDRPIALAFPKPRSHDLLADGNAKPARGTDLDTLVGHAIGVVAGLAAVFACAAIDQASGMSGNGPTLARIAATAIAVGATIALQIVVSAEHPPAAATTMLISLGALPPDGRTIGVIAAGVVLCSGLGEIGRLIYPLRTKR